MPPIIERNQRWYRVTVYTESKSIKSVSTIGKEDIVFPITPTKDDSDTEIRIDVPHFSEEEAVTAALISLKRRGVI